MWAEGAIPLRVFEYTESRFDSCILTEHLYPIPSSTKLKFLSMKAPQEAYVDSSTG
jgi:hypothetical protein